MSYRKKFSIKIAYNLDKWFTLFLLIPQKSKTYPTLTSVNF